MSHPASLATRSMEPAVIPTGLSLRRGAGAIRLGALLMALFLYTPAWADPNEEEETLFDGATELIDAKHYEEAEVILNGLVKRNPHNALYWFNLGSARYNQGKIPPAAEAFDKVITLKSPLTPAARLSLAKCRRRQAEFGAALKMLRKIQKAGAAGLEEALSSELSTLRNAALDSATESYENQRFEEALSGFKTAADIRADSDVNFMVGLTLLRLERADEAKPALLRAESLSRGGPLREQSRYFLERIDHPSTATAGWAFLEFGLGYNSNIFLESSNFDPTASAATQTLLSGGVQILKKADHSLGVAYLLYWEEALGDSEGRFLSQTWRGDFAYVEDPWRFRAFPSLQHQIYGTDPFLLKASLSLQAQRGFGPNFYGRFQYEMGRNFGQLSEYQYLNGSTHGVRATVGYTEADLDANMFYTLLVDGSGDLISGGTTLPLKSVSHGPGMRLSWEPVDKWDMAVSLSFLSRGYSNLSQPGGVARTDGQLNLTARATYRWTSNLQFFGSLSTLANSSTLDETSAVDDKNYTQVIALTGFTWDILN